MSFGALDNHHDCVGGNKIRMLMLVVNDMTRMMLTTTMTSRLLTAHRIDDLDCPTTLDAGCAATCAERRNVEMLTSIHEGPYLARSSDYLIVSHMYAPRRTHLEWPAKRLVAVHLHHLQPLRLQLLPLGLHDWFVQQVVRRHHWPEQRATRAP